MFSAIFNIILTSLVSPVATLPLDDCPRDLSLPTWTITTLTTHFMGSNSGIANGAWPPGAAFNSSISFELGIQTAQADNTSATPATAMATCSASWIPGSDDWPHTVNIPCGMAEDDGSGTSASWMFQSPNAFLDQGDVTAFTLELESLESFDECPTMQYVGSLQLVTGEWGQPDNMVCLGGAPLTGIHCSGGPYTIFVQEGTPA